MRAGSGRVNLWVTPHDLGLPSCDSLFGIGFNGGMAERSLWGTRAFHLRHTLTTFNWVAAEREKRGRQEEERKEGVSNPLFFFREVVYAQLNQGGQRWVWGDTAGLIWTIRSQVVPVPEGMCGAVSSPSLVIKSLCHPPPPRRRADPHRARRRAADQRCVNYTQV